MQLGVNYFTLVHIVLWLQPQRGYKSVKIREQSSLSFVPLRTMLCFRDTNRGTLSHRYKTGSREKWARKDFPLRSRYHLGHSHCWLLGPASVHCTECAGCSGPAPWGSGHMCSERIQEQLPVATLCTHHIRRNACPPLPRLQLLPQLSPGSLRNCHQTPLSLLNLISPLRSPFDLQCIRTPWLCKPPLLTFIS